MSDKPKEPAAEPEPNPEEPKPTLEEAQRIISEERQARAAACWAELEPILKKHNCELNARGVLEVIPK